MCVLGVVVVVVVRGHNHKKNLDRVQEKNFKYDSSGLGNDYAEPIRLYFFCLCSLFQITSLLHLTWPGVAGGRQF